MCVTSFVKNHCVKGLKANLTNSMQLEENRIFTSLGLNQLILCFYSDLIFSYIHSLLLRCCCCPSTNFELCSLLLFFHYLLFFNFIFLVDLHTHVRAHTHYIVVYPEFLSPSCYP